MANVSVYNMEGNEVGTLELNDAVFGVEVNEHPPLWTRKLILLSVLTKWTIRTDLQVDSPRRYDLASL